MFSLREESIEICNCQEETGISDLKFPPAAFVLCTFKNLMLIPIFLWEAIELSYKRLKNNTADKAKQNAAKIKEQKVQANPKK